MNQNRTAADVAQLESEVIILRGEIEAERSRVAVLEAENTTLKIEKARLEQRTREEMTKATEVETILNMVSSGLVGALSRLKNSRTLQKQALRAAQEEELGVGQEDSAFRPQTPPPHPAPVYRETDEDRADRLRGAAERVTEHQRVPRLGTVRTDIQDERLPLVRPRFVPDANSGTLEELAGGVQSRTSRA